MVQNKYDIVVVGGGFFGSSIALFYAERGKSVLLVEKENSLMKRASLNNQARVHRGYHYPRSLLTGLRSRENYGVFLERFHNCIDGSFKNYYAISSKFSNVSANQFALFCKRIKAPIKDAPAQISKLFNSLMIKSIFEVEECAFNALLLAEEMNEAIKRTPITTLLNSEVINIGDGLTVKIKSDVELEVKADEVFLCTYAETNRVLFASGLPMIPLRHELTEIALVNPPLELEGIGVTVMCGPFFSLMPYPARGLYSFSHVRYTPHFSWDEGDNYGEPPAVSRDGETHFKFMLKDSLRYLPALKETSYVDSLWEVKTILPRNEGDDARPILFKRNHGFKGVHCIIGGKIDNVFDVIKQIEGI
jgi:glycine/D-amino acid oxidase-like deaminating enzyme